MNNNNARIALKKIHLPIILLLSVALTACLEVDSGWNKLVAPGETVTLMGIVESKAPEVTNIEWTQVSGTPVVLSDPSILTPSFTAPNTEGALVFSLTATITEGEADEEETDDVLITVRATTSQNADAPSDYDGDGRSDFLLRHEGFPGTWDIAYMDGPDSSNIASLPGLPVGEGYYTVATLDFNGDGDTDVLLRDAFGSWFVYIVQNGAVVNSKTLPILPLPGETIFYKGDIDNDGKADLMLRHPTSGAVRVYYMDGVNIKSEQTIDDMPGFDYRPETSGDYDGDGVPEFLLRKAASGLQLEWWYFDVDFGSGNATGFPLPELDQAAGMDWVGLTSQDFDGDGDDEPLMRSLLSPYGWQLVQLDGTFVGQADALAFDEIGFLEVASGPTVLGMDTNGNGYKEVVLRNEGLNLYHFYEMDGPTIINEGRISIPALPAARRSQVN